MNHTGIATIDRCIVCFHCGSYNNRPVGKNAIIKWVNKNSDANRKSREISLYPVILNVFKVSLLNRNCFLDHWKIETYCAGLIFVRVKTSQCLVQKGVGAHQTFQGALFRLFFIPFFYRTGEHKFTL